MQPFAAARSRLTLCTNPEDVLYPIFRSCGLSFVSFGKDYVVSTSTGSLIIRETKEQVADLCSTLKNFTGEQPIVLLAFQANHSGMFDNCGVHEDEVVPGPAFLSKDGATEV